MKKFAFITLAFAASLVAADVTGAYAGKGSIESTKYGGVPYTAQLTLLQDGSSVSGTLKMGGAKVAANNFRDYLRKPNHLCRWAE